MLFQGLLVFFFPKHIMIESSRFNYFEYKSNGDKNKILDPYQLKNILIKSSYN